MLWFFFTVTASAKLREDYIIKSFEKETKQFSIQSAYSVTEVPEKLSRSPVSSPIRIGSPVKSYCPPPPTVSHVGPQPYTSPYGNVPETLRSKPTFPSDKNVVKKPCEKATAIRWSGYPPEAVSIVRPTTFVPDKDQFVQRVNVYPDYMKSKSVSVTPDYVPEQRDKPAGLDVDDFLPVSFPIGYFFFYVSKCWMQFLW